MSDYQCAFSIILIKLLTPSSQCGNFSVIMSLKKILREKLLFKTVILTILKGLNFDIIEFVPFLGLKLAIFELQKFDVM